MYFENIRPEDIFRQRRFGKCILIDVRNREEYLEGCIPGAVNIPYDELEERVADLRQEVLYNSEKGSRTIIILYCERGNTSLKAARDLYRQGFLIKNVYGGIRAYRGPLAHPEKS